LNRVPSAVVFAVLLLGGIQLELGGRHTFAVILLVGAGLTLVWLILPRRRRFH